MELVRIKIWELSDAPAELRALLPEPARPEWLALVPGSLWGTDLEEVIRDRAEPGSVSSYELASGHFIYTGRMRSKRAMHAKAT